MAKVMVRLKLERSVAEQIWDCEREWRKQEITLDEGVSWLSNPYMRELSILFCRREFLLQTWKRGGMSEERLERWHNLMRKTDEAIERVIQDLKKRQEKHGNYVSPDL